jgi:hypothetical protein
MKDIFQQWLRCKSRANHLTCDPWHIATFRVGSWWSGTRLYFAFCEAHLVRGPVTTKKELAGELWVKANKEGKVL